MILGYLLILWEGDDPGDESQLRCDAAATQLETAEQPVDPVERWLRWLPMMRGHLNCLKTFSLFHIIENKGKPSMMFHDVP